MEQLEREKVLNEYFAAERNARLVDSRRILVTRGGGGARKKHLQHWEKRIEEVVVTWNPFIVPCNRDTVIVNTGSDGPFNFGDKWNLNKREAGENDIMMGGNPGLLFAADYEQK